MAAKIDPRELVTAADIARRLDISPQRVHQLNQQDRRFPTSEGRVGASDVWRWSKIEAWQRQRAKEQWIAEAVALVPRTGGILQSKFRSSLQNYLSHALGKKSEMRGASVAEVVRQAMEGLGGLPRFDPKLLTLEWPEV